MKKNNSKHILQSWKSFIEEAGVEKSALCVSALNANQQFSLKELEKSDVDSGIRLSIPARNCTWLRDKINMDNPVYFLFPLIKKYDDKKKQSTILPLFMLDITLWLSSANNELILPVKSGNSISIVKQVFDNQYLLNSNVDEIESENIFSFIKSLTGSSGISFDDIYASLLQWVEERLDGKRNISLQTYDAVISNFTNDDFNTKRDLKDFNSLLKDEQFPETYPLLHTYITQSSTEKTVHVPSKPIYGLFEDNYPLGYGQIETISQIAHGEKLTAVQGAPGTGKTTLFKSLIANQLVTRALDIISGNDKNRSMVVTSTAIKAVDNVIDDLKEDSCINGLDWLYFQGGSKKRVSEELERVDRLIREITVNEYCNEKHKVAKKQILKNKAAIDGGFATFITKQNEIRENLKKLNTLLKKYGCESIESLSQKKDGVFSQLKDFSDCVGYQEDLRNRNKNKVGVWISKQIESYRQTIEKYDEAQKIEKMIQANTPYVLSGKYVLCWMKNDISKIIEENFSCYPNGFLTRLWLRIFPNKYLRKWKQIQSTYTKEIGNFDLTEKSFFELGALAKYTTGLRKDEELENITRVLDEGMPSKDHLANIEKFHRAYNSYVEIDCACSDIEKNISERKRLDEDFFNIFRDCDETDSLKVRWLDIERKGFISENRELFESAVTFLWQEILSRKETLLNIIEHWSNMMAGKISSGYHTWKKQDKISEFYLNLSLVYPLMASPLPSLYKLAGYKTLDELGTVKPYNLCLVDEAGMVSVEALVPSLCRSTSAAIVGDPLQLEPIRTLSKHSENIIRNKYYENHLELYGRISPQLVTAYHRAAGAETGEVSDIGQGIVLDEHRRCQPRIATLFMELAGYNVKDISVKTSSPNEGIQNAFDKMGGYHRMFYGIQGRLGDLPRTNVDEVEVIGEVLEKLKGAGYDLTKDVGIITPYSNQKAMLIKKWGAALSHTNKSLKIGSVHQFQGVGFEVIIYSPVIFQPSDPDGFQNQKPNLLNVAVSRAKQQFIVVGNYQKLVSSGGYLKKLACRCAEDFLIEMEHQSPKYEKISKLNGNDIALIHNCDHLEVFKSLIEGAKESVKVIVPWFYNPEVHPQFDILKKAKDRQVDVKVYYGYNGNNDDKKDGDKTLIDRYKKEFRANLIRLENGTHEKILIVDDTVVVGSWNWLSHQYHSFCAKPNQANVSVRGETSLKTKNNKIVQEILNGLGGS